MGVVGREGLQKGTGNFQGLWIRSSAWCGDGLTGIHIFQNIRRYTLNTCGLLYGRYSQYGCKKLGPTRRISKEWNLAQHGNGHFNSLILPPLRRAAWRWFSCEEVVLLSWSAAHPWTQPSCTPACLFSLIYHCLPLHSLCSSHPDLSSFPRIRHILSLP